MRVLLGLILIGFFLIQPSQADERTYYYKVQKGDSLTVILYSLGIFPVWNKVPEVQELNNMRVKKNPDYLWVDQKLILPKPNPIFEANYRILTDGEIIILSKIRTKKEKEDFLSQRGLKEVTPKDSPNKSIIAFKNDEKELPRQVERVYLNYGLLFNSTSTEQILPKTNSVSGTNTLESINTGVSIETAFRLKHHFYFDAQYFTLPTADSSEFTQDTFTMFNLSYSYGHEFSQRATLLFGLGYKEKVFFPEITQEKITVKKGQYISPSVGLMYFAPSRIYEAIPRFIFNIGYNPELSIAGKTVESHFEYSFLGGAFFNLSEASHFEVSLGFSYQNYMIDDYDSTDIGAKVIVKYGKEFFF